MKKALIPLILCLPSLCISAKKVDTQADLNCGLLFNYFLGANDVSSFTLSSDIFSQIKLDFENGYYGGISVGYRHKHFRFEEELSLRYNIINNYSDLPGAPGTCDTLKVSGEVMVVSLMSNIYWDFLIGNTVMPFIGIGGGGAFLGNTVTEPNPGADFSKNVYGFAWQLMAGIGILLDYQSELDIVYKFYEANLFDYMNGVSNCASIPAGPGESVTFSPIYKANTLAIEWRIPPL